MIVGAGSTGCVIAARVAAAGFSVLLLEAGDDDASLAISTPAAAFDLQQAPEDWQLKTTPQKHMGGRTINLPRGKMLGGCSGSNCMVFVRGHPDNFDSWARRGCDGWSYEEVLPYFKRLEDCSSIPEEAAPRSHRGVGGPVKVWLDPDQNPTTLRFLAACEEAGLPYVNDYNGASQLGAGKTQANIWDGRRQSTAVAYLPPPSRGITGMCPDRFRRTEKLTVSCLSYVTKVDIEEGRATGVRLRRGSLDLAVLRTSPEEVVRAKREVIVCAGAYHSPWLLMLSGVGPESHLSGLGIPVKRDLPVGQNLSDHIMVPIMYASKSKDPVVVRSLVSRLAITSEYLLHKTGPASKVALPGTAFLLSDQGVHPEDVWGTTKSPNPAADIQIHFVPAMMPQEFFDKLGLASLKIAETLPLHGVNIIPILLRPVSRGVVLLKSADPFDEPIIDHRFLEHPRDLAVLMDSVRVTRRIAKTAAFKEELMEIKHPDIPFDIESDDYAAEMIRRVGSTVYHPVGTCCMGSPSSSDTVVDPRARVVGVAGLRVADCSIMPTVPSGNTNVPAIMVGEKVAEMILQDARASV